jgi:cobalt/nickel transport system permease protein
MHIPDGFLNTPTWIGSSLISITGLAVAFKKVTRVLNEKMVPLMGVMASFIFAAQMLNFPVAGGTSGHLLGGVLAAVLLGPLAGAIVISVVLVAQALIFQDGGITALGANILNMSFVGTVGGYSIYFLIRKIVSGRMGILIATFISAWASVILASTACSLELAISGTSPLKIVLTAMAGIHVLIGVGEGVITLFIVSFLLKVRPDLIYSSGEVR